jgi:hypothetical protein
VGGKSEVNGPQFSDDFNTTTSMPITTPSTEVSRPIGGNAEDVSGHAVQSETIKRTAYCKLSHACQTHTEISDEAFFRENSQGHAYTI